jgi:threonine/homoserine/homoserine lactone efflux protein
VYLIFLGITLLRSSCRKQAQNANRFATQHERHHDVGPRRGPLRCHGALARLRGIHPLTRNIQRAGAVVLMALGVRASADALA